MTHSDTHRDSFRFGVEAEYQLADAETFRPLWHQDLSFEELNQVLESIAVDDLPPVVGLELEPPHRKLMPYAVEGYHVPAPDLSPIDLLPKGIEIRTPVCSSIEQCLATLKTLHDRLETALLGRGYALVSLSHHPTEHHFEGPQNKRRYDFWQWAMEVMTTCGPDINVSLPHELNDCIDVADLHRKVNYYSPALAALSLASPIYRGELWSMRGAVGKSIRTYRRSVIAPAIELHPQENGRMEFKLFEATNQLVDYHAFILLWLTLLLDNELDGRAHNQTRVYDLGAISRFGLEAETVRERATAVLTRSPVVLEKYGFDIGPLSVMQRRLETGRLPADDIIDCFRETGSLEHVLRLRAGLVDNADVTPYSFDN
ncbi:glutamate-cysteine ligase family protein [Gimesia sp.]|uniref:glutamate-cysteine ligase family protein n=1 Tax=Gimesia sp. TaxID=2024833 RepID=UPI0025BC8515|nr:glutamate-cysteine ligase family protein [Gimesia sp.]|tara:strand:- start:1079 stop:2194 length:1116 start_codon:yes stop_codon:yes gene_type:complete